MNLEVLAEQASEQLRDLILDAGKDIEALVEQCERESARQGRRILPRVGFGLTIEWPRVVVSMGYGARVKREAIIELSDPNQAELPGVGRAKK